MGEAEIEATQEQILDALNKLVETKNENFFKKWAEKIIISLSIMLIVALLTAAFAFHDMQQAVDNFEKTYAKKTEIDQIQEARKTTKDDVNFNFKTLGKLHNLELKEVK